MSCSRDEGLSRFGGGVALTMKRLPSLYVSSLSLVLVSQLAGCTDDEVPSETSAGATDTTGGATDGPALTTNTPLTSGGDTTGGDTEADSTGQATGGETEETDGETETTGGVVSNTFDVEIINDIGLDFSGGDIMLSMRVRKEGFDFAFGPGGLTLELTNVVLFDTVVELDGPGVVSVEWPTLPDEAMLPLTCEEVNLTTADGPTPNCVENPDDRYAQVSMVVFRDLNGNGMLDQLGPEGGAFTDEVLTSSYPGALFFVQQFDAEFIRNATLQAGWGDFDPVAFEPGWHVTDNLPVRSQELCTELFYAKQDGCQVIETTCADNGGGQAECQAEFLECMSPMSPEQRAECEIPVDVPGYAILRELEQDADNNVAWLCETTITAIDGTCDTATDTLLEPLADNCSADGGSYTFVGRHDWDPAAPCTHGYECTTDVSLPDGPVPADWPCDVANVPDNPVPAQWACNVDYYASADGCDCGCGAPDPDCADLMVASCEYCGNAGSCNAGPCPGSIDPVNNAVCAP